LEDGAGAKRTLIIWDGANHFSIFLPHDNENKPAHWSMAVLFNVPYFAPFGH
jgi:hypothetical protein